MSELVRYYFKPTGKLSQGSTLFNKTKTPIFEANLTKFRLFSSCDFEFINHLSGMKSVHKIGKTITTSTGFGSYEFVNNSYFSFDGENVWDLFKKNNIVIKGEIQKLVKPIYSVYSGNELIAKIETSSVNLFEGDPKKGLDIPCPGYYRIDMNEDYVFFIFLVAFALFKTDIV